MTLSTKKAPGRVTYQTTSSPTPSDVSRVPCAAKLMTSPMRDHDALVSVAPETPGCQSGSTSRRCHDAAWSPEPAARTIAAGASVEINGTEAKVQCGRLEIDGSWQVAKRVALWLPR